ncbi:transposase [candidate division WOR-3 bacterium]|nr:transposase [candidate division WOR-3 bacterium]
MNKPRIKLINHFYHVMNRGDKGEYIFDDDKMKQLFLKELSFFKNKYLIKLSAFCIMGNHFHLIIKDENGWISEFMHDLETIFALKYRKENGGKGYVFQNRFKSQIIHYEKYMQNAIIYVLNNPCRKHLVNDPLSYHWSSAALHFNKSVNFLDKKITKDLFGSRKNFLYCLNSRVDIKEHIIETPIGQILGDQWYASSILGRYNKRMNNSYSSGKRKNDKLNISIQSALMLFEYRNKMYLRDIDFHSRYGKMVRNNLLVFLRNECQMRYSEINHAYPFFNMKYNALAKTYSRCCKT